MLCVTTVTICSFEWIDACCILSEYLIVSLSILQLTGSAIKLRQYGGHPEKKCNRCGVTLPFTIMISGRNFFEHLDIVDTMNLGRIKYLLCRSHAIDVSHWQTNTCLYSVIPLSILNLTMMNIEVRIIL